MFRFLLSAGLLASSVVFAQAASKCPAGQIYRVSKKICVDKSTAIRDGVLSAREKARRPFASKANENAMSKAVSRTQETVHSRPKATTEMARLADDTGAPSWASGQDRGETTRAITAPSSVGPILMPAVKTTSVETSPFGALSNPWTSSVRNAFHPSRFSLQPTVGN
jgi:hypothetical protein